MGKQQMALRCRSVSTTWVSNERLDEDIKRFNKKMLSVPTQDSLQTSSIHLHKLNMGDTEDEIAVIGMGCNFPGGEGLQHFWNVLLEGRNCGGPIPNERFDMSEWYDPDDNKSGKSRTQKAALIDGLNEFDHKFFGMSETEVEQMDPQHRLLLESTYRTLENAGLPMEKASGTRTGVFVGLMNRDYESCAVQRSPNSINHYTGTGMVMSIAANRVSYMFNLTGPSLSIDCACSSSLVAIHLGCQALKQGDCEMALCGGVSCIINPWIFVALSKAKMISPEGTSKPFSSRADGYGRGEGCGMVLLKPLKQALKDGNEIWGIISKTAVNQDGRSVTPITKPSMVQQEALLRTIYSASDLSNVQYIEAHGTGTPVGDPIEAGTISKVIATARPPGSDTLRIGSVKGNIGHTESAAGVAGLIKVLLMMKYKTIVPSVFYSEDSASIDVKALNLKVPTKPEKWSDAVMVAGINNFGFGGTNAHAIVKQYKQTHTPKKSGRKSHKCFVLSGSSIKSIDMMMEDTIQQIDENSEFDLESLVYTSACRRSHLKHRYRRAFMTSTLADLKNQLKLTLNKNIALSNPDTRLVFVFCGNGVTYQGMCKQLLREEPVFREKVREVESLFQRFSNMAILDRLEVESGVDDFSKPEVIQPLLFAVQVGIASLLKHWGVRPDAVLGHSVGEVAAAHCSGLLSLEDAVKVIYHRSILQGMVTGGKMLVISNMAVLEILKMLPDYSGKICMAAYNSPQSCTLSGDADAIKSLHQKLSMSDKSKTLFFHILDVPAAYHSHLMDPILTQIEDRVGSLKVNETETKLFSTVTGKEVEQADFTTGKYWARNIREPVAFEQAVRSAADQKKNVVFVEIGPRRALQRNIMETLGKDITVISSVKPEKDHETMLSVFSKLFELGVCVDWDQFYKGCEVSPTPFPRYRFDYKKVELINGKWQKETSSNHKALSQNSDGDGFSCDLSLPSLSYLLEHKHNGVPLLPGAFYADLGLTVALESVKPKVPLNTLQLSIDFLSPFILTQNAPEIQVHVEPHEGKTRFKMQSSTATYAMGIVVCKRERLIEEQNISLSSIYKTCKLLITSEKLYSDLNSIGFQYGNVFQNKGDIHYGDEFGEAISVVTVSEEFVFDGRPGFPARIGSLTVNEPLQEEMIIYLRATKVEDRQFEVCGCFADKEGRVLVELRDVLIKYLGSHAAVLEEDFYHNEFRVVSEDMASSRGRKTLVFSDQLGISRSLQQHLSSKSKYISFTHAKDILTHGFPTLLANLKITDIKKNFEEVLFVWGNEDLTAHTSESVLDNMVNCCETFRQVILELRDTRFTNSIRAITYRSAETTVDHISSGFALSGMIRSCAAEMAELSIQWIDINSMSTDDIQALSHILRSYPCSKYAELVVKNGLVFNSTIVHIPLEKTESSISEGKVCSTTEPCTFQTTDPYRLTTLSAIPSDLENQYIPDKTVEIQLNKMCVHSADYFPVSVSDLNFGQTLYWSKHDAQNHNVLALDFNGTVTAVGKGVRKLKVGDQVVSCYPVVASTKIIVPEEACYKTKRFPFLKETPCVSYFVLAWEIMNRALPKVKEQKKTLGIVTSICDSALLKVLSLTASKSGWGIHVGGQCNGVFVDVDAIDAFVLLHPFDESLVAKAVNFPGVKHVVIVCESHTQGLLTHTVVRSEKDSVRTQNILMTIILQKGSLRAQMPHVYHWLKSLNLDRRAFVLDSFTFQRQTSGSIEFLPLDEQNSYFSSRMVPVVALCKEDSRGALSNIPLQQKPSQLFQKRAVYIVTGGLTGLGFETVRFISKKGGGHVVIFSRRNPSPDMQVDINNVEKETGSCIVCIKCDVSVSEDVQNAIGQIGKNFRSCPIRGVFHSAVVLHDELIETLDKSLFEKVMKPKVNGALNLHHATEQCKLDYFVCYSSISAFIGNAAQINYSAANTFLDTFCQYRRNIGLAGQSINWGALNIGLLLNKDHFHRFLEAKGLMVMDVAEIHEGLEQALLLNKPQQAVCRFHYKNIINNILPKNAALKVRLIDVMEKTLRKTQLSDSKADTTVSLSPPAEYIKSLLSETLGVDKNELHEESTLYALGIDSMLAMTLQNRIFHERGVNLPLVKILDPDASLSTLIAVLGEGTEVKGDDEEAVLDATRL
ncbi:phenolphthiocerol/phthiocerol polyketide synthase subunit C-like isoform X3 [Hypomesus transpacificus]|uniref:phenolphthiocerol/phthiocerol polyketide synthase subunit C-like isoform X3 n=1 Tax=Hypomesus transpacificus TaxID=137520 RepID=UPI001F07295C|nr:phenolphthiocerol/phthiocerol polyketide synthase subunit C-like isoform X3 [Hypomesus transpacificus]